jgi:hypothetical protein
VRLGRRNLPVFFESLGGFGHHAIAIGRFMRERGMTAGVARTIPEACAGADARVCEKAKKSGKELRAEWSSIGAHCISACVYAVIGARVRLVPPGSRLAIHAARDLCLLSTGAVLDGTDPRCPKQNSKIELSRYVRQMGADPALVESAFQVPHESFRLLSREEVVRFGIAQRELHDTPWMVLRDENFILSFVSDSSDPSGVIRQAGAIALGCQPSNRLLIIYFRPAKLISLLENADIATLIGDEKFTLAPAAFSSRFEQLDPEGLFDRYAKLVPFRPVDHNAFRLKIEIRHAGLTEDTTLTVLHPTSDGFKRAWAKLQQRCATN